MLLEGMTAQFGRDEFKLFESWIDRITSWADHDALVHYLIGPMVAADDRYLARLPVWAKKKSVWHQRAAAVSLIHSTRQHKNFEHIQRITELLLASDDDMVQKGLGWLLREAAKANPEQTVAYLMTIRERTPRLVLAHRCETLPHGDARAAGAGQAEQIRPALHLQWNPHEPLRNSGCPARRRPRMPGSFTTIIIAIPSPTACWDCRPTASPPAAGSTSSRPTASR